MNLDDLIEFFDAPSSVSFKLTPMEALAYFNAKGLKTTFDWRDMLGEEHVASFTVAKMMDQDLLADVHASLGAAMADGRSFQAWADELRPLLQAKGWWGREAVIDPLTGQTVVAKLGTAGRLKTIFRTNVQSAYAAGAWQQIESQKASAPYLIYDAVDDWRTRESHAEHDNKALPVDDPFWQVWYPPNGYNCRCGVIQVDAEELAQLGLTPTPSGGSIPTEKWTNPRTGKVEKVPVGQDPGFAFNGGKVRLDSLLKIAAEKVATLAAAEHAAAAQQAAAAQGMKAAQEAAQKALEADVVAAHKLAVKAEGQAKLAASQMKAAQRAAQFQIDQAVIQKTPYLSTAIAQLQKAGKTFGSPAELLEAAKTAAAKAKQSNFLSEWKKAYVADKKPSANAQTAFDALPIDAQSALKQVLDADKLSVKLEAQALAKLDEITAPGSAVSQSQKDVLAKLAADPGFGILPASQKLAKFEAAYADFQAAKNAASALSNYKKAILAGKTPSAGQKAAFDALTPDAQAKFLAKVQKDMAANAPAPAAAAATSADSQAAALFDQFEADGMKGVAIQFGGIIGKKSWLQMPEGVKQGIVDQWKATHAKLVGGMKPNLAPAPLNVEPPTPTLEARNLTQIGPQKGSNPGGQFQDTTTGEKFYVKLFDSADKVNNEVLAAELYKLVGAEVPELTIVAWPDGRLGLASRWVDGLKKGTPNKLLQAEGAAEFFATDAWLANWDVVGLSYDNLALNGARAFRVDVGGSLRYRAQGTLKGTDWNDDVLEIDSLRNPNGSNQQAASVFGSLTDDQIVDSVRRVLRPSDQEIAALVDRWGPDNAAAKKELLRTLLARRETLRKRFPNASPAQIVTAPPPGSVVVQASEHKTIMASRSNGATIKTDGDAIEDHNVLVAHHIGTKGPFTRVSLKLTPQAGERVRALLAPKAKGGKVSANSIGVDNSALKSSVLTWVKGVNSRFKSGAVLEAKDIDRANTARTALAARRAELIKLRTQVDAKAKPALENQIAMLETFDKPIEEFLKTAVVGQKAQAAIPMLDLARLPDLSEFAKPALKKAAVAAPEAVQWDYIKTLPGEQSTFQRGYVSHGSGGSGQDVGAPILRGTGQNGERILVMKDPGMQRAVDGTVWIDVPGHDLASAQRAFDLIADQLQVSTTRTSLAERSEQYLNAFARMRLFNSTHKAAWDQFEKISAGMISTAEKVRLKIDLLNKRLGLDIEKSDGWAKRDGIEQAFGHGRISQLRADTDTPEWQKFEAEYGIYHNPSGLGWDAGSSVPDKLLRFLDTGGGILAQMERLRRGIYGSGASPGADRSSGGAAYVFTRLFKRSGGKGNAAGFYWKARVVRRVDSISYDGDDFGRTEDSTLLYGRRSTVAELESAASNSSNETIFKQGLSLFDDLDAVVVEDSQLATTLAKVRAAGYSQWPDGRKLEDVILSESEWKKTKAKRGK